MEQTATLRTFFRYAAPGILGQVGISLYILADTFFVSQGAGAAGLAALNLALPAFNLMNGIGLMIGVGGATQFAFRRAQAQHEEADRVFTHATGLALVAGLCFLLLGVCAAAPLARLLGADAQTFAMTRVYLRTLLCFAPCFLLNNVLLAFVRNDGRPDRAMCGMIVGSLSNVVLDYVFIFPLGLGMFGAALATGVSPIISTLILSGHLRTPQCGLHLRRMRPQPALLPALCVPGLPALISELSSGLVLLLFNQALLHLAGNIAIAAYGVIANLALVGVAIFTGLSTGTQPLISHHSGANDALALRRLLIHSGATALAIAAVLYTVVYAGAAPIVGAFNSDNDPTLARYAVDGLRLYFAGFWCAGLNIVYASFFSAAGRTTQGFWLSMLRGVIAIPPLLLLLATQLGVTGVWATFPAVECLTVLPTLVCAARLYRGGR